MRSVSIFFFICHTGLISCNRTSQDLPHFSAFKNEKDLNERKVAQIASLVPDGLLLFNDTILIIRNKARSSTTHFTSFNIKTRKQEKTYFPIGRKKGQSLGFLSYEIFHNRLWVIDIVKERLLFEDLNVSKQDTLTNEYPVSAFYYATQLLNDSLLIGSGEYDSDFKIHVINYKTGRIQDSIISYNNKDGASRKREDKMAYESFLFSKPTNDKCVLACRYADQIEIVDLNKKSSIIVRGPKGYEPDVMVAIGNDGKKLSTRNGNTRFAFLKGKTTDNFIYLLYSGYNNLSDHSYYGNCLYVYDWNGKPIKKLNFKDDVLDFAVTSDDKTIYAYHPKNKYITESTAF